MGKNIHNRIKDTTTNSTNPNLRLSGMAKNMQKVKKKAACEKKRAKFSFSFSLSRTNASPLSLSVSIFISFSFSLSRTNLHLFLSLSHFPPYFPSLLSLPAIPITTSSSSSLGPNHCLSPTEPPTGALTKKKNGSKVNLSDTPAYKQYVAGLLIGVSTVAIGHPFDTVKLWRYFKSSGLECNITSFWNAKEMAQAFPGDINNFTQGICQRRFV
ncbi:uncharacterized protein LOC133823928 [Humulus lupulus]|uniref:uncharacterized protein LOC133823928 n=1 Tax=Humulus lupulus TaxID=3486 RepID=UPI002B4126A2|nr:uncharacterized protein LOC133823928 [Humulus lupulus]